MTITDIDARLVEICDLALQGPLPPRVAERYAQEIEALQAIRARLLNMGRSRATDRQLQMGSR